ncbi:hypothetical protein pipiens_003084 [Culex pipiens pipiens]|uniref:Chitin-binding type-2 domain-containing protein n=1 Tax=Culex pipiens pipiens TaxID=38569 RepID=A0ABD1D3Z1_CULPP
MKLSTLTALVIGAILASETSADVCGPNPRCPAGYYDYMLPHYDCDKFYLCENGIACEQNCPAGLHFNAFRQRCEAPEQACCDIYLPCFPEEFVFVLSGSSEVILTNNGAYLVKV